MSIRTDTRRGHNVTLCRGLEILGLDAQAYLDHGLSVGAMAKEDKLWLGWGIHILNGVAALQTEEFDVTWTTDALDYSWTVEGAATARAVKKLAQERGIDMPISTVVADLASGETDVMTALNTLLSRPLKEE